MAQIETADILVVGAGMGGLTAALAAQQEGARVILAEKAATCGGSFALSGGYIWTVPTVALYQAIVPHGDPELGRMLVGDFEHAIAWLREQGVRLGPRREGLFAHGVGCGYRLEPDPVSAGIAPLVSAFERRGGTLSCATPARQLLVDEETGRVVGARLASPGGPRTIRCRAVILATGGFQGDVELLTRYISPWADRLFLRASPTSTGDGLRMALAAGAATSRGLRAFYGHLLPAPPTRITPAAFRTLALYNSPHAVLLNLRGERFVDESIADEQTTQALARQPEARGFLVFDELCYREHILRPHLPDGPIRDPLADIPAAGGVVLRAETLPDLAAALAAYGVPPRVAQATLAEYDAAAAAGAPERLPVPRRRNLHRLQRPPFHAIPAQPGLTFTHGGVRIDTTCQALDRDGRPVPGLYVAGVDAGGIFYEGYVGGLAASLVTGLRAGIHAARSPQ